MSGNSSCASTAEMSDISSPLDAAQPDWRWISSQRSWVEASRMLPHCTQPGGVSPCCSEEYSSTE